MDETLRVKIVADVSQANSSLKQLNTDTKKLETGTGAANDAIAQLNKTLNSLGFRAQRFTALSTIFKKPKESIKKDIGSIASNFKSLK